MINSEYIALLPLIIPGGGAVLLLLGVAIRRSHIFTALSSILILTAAFVSLFFSVNDSVEIGYLLIMDNFSILFSGMIILASIFILLISFSYFRDRTEVSEEYYILILIATLGSVTLVSSQHFVSFFLGLELLSSSLYVLIAYIRERDFSIEAGVKYLILAAVSSALILFGMALIYSSSGTMYFPGLADYFDKEIKGIVDLSGIVFILAGIGFKLALVPFHMWTPDVYEGAPAPVSAFVATVSKAGVFAFLLRFVSETNSDSIPIMIFLGLISAVSMLAGSVLALLEKNVKKILAYSSIAHLGYLIVAFLSGGEMAAESSAFYLATYIISITGAFGIVAYISGIKKDISDINDFRGLVHNNPFIAAMFTIILFSLAGLPLTAGFPGKFFILAAGVKAELWWLVIILVISSSIGIFYYLRIIVSMFVPANETSKVQVFTPSVLQLTVLTILSFLILVIGLYPSFLIKIVGVLIGDIFQ